MADTIAESYGNAAFELAQEEGFLMKLQEEIPILLEVFKEGDEFEKFLKSERIGKKEKSRMIAKLLGDRIAEPILFYLSFVIEKGYGGELPGILEQIDRRIKQSAKHKKATVITAIPLTEERKQEIEGALLQITEASSLEIIWRVEAGILGGLVVQIGEMIFDSSVHTKLGQMETHILSI